MSKPYFEVSDEVLDARRSCSVVEQLSTFALDSMASAAPISPPQRTGRGGRKNARARKAMQDASIADSVAIPTGYCVSNSSGVVVWPSSVEGRLPTKEEAIQAAKGIVGAVVEPVWDVPSDGIKIGRREE